MPEQIENKQGHENVADFGPSGLQITEKLGEAIMEHAHSISRMNTVRLATSLFKPPVQALLRVLVWLWLAGLSCGQASCCIAQQVIMHCSIDQGPTSSHWPAFAAA